MAEAHVSHGPDARRAGFPGRLARKADTIGLSRLALGTPFRDAEVARPGALTRCAGAGFSFSAAGPRPGGRSTMMRKREVAAAAIAALGLYGPNALALPQRAVLDGKDLQPRPPEGQVPAPPDVSRLLLEHSEDAAPSAAPHDLYGRPFAPEPVIGPHAPPDRDSAPAR
jgi:hypothetical protein